MLIGSGLLRLLLPGDSLRSELLRILNAFGIGIAGIGHRRNGTEQRLGPIAGGDIAGCSSTAAAAATAAQHRCRRAGILRAL